MKTEYGFRTESCDKNSRQGSLRVVELAHDYIYVGWQVFRAIDSFRAGMFVSHQKLIEEAGVDWRIGYHRKTSIKYFLK
jgi:hypothetical protein